MNKINIDFTVRRQPGSFEKKADIISVNPLKSEQMFYVKDICQILGIGKSLAYRLIAKVHSSQPDQRICKSPGCISRQLFLEQLYGAAPRKEKTI